MALKTIFAEQFQNVQTPVLAAVSGGADSTALAWLLHETQIPFGIAHFSHHMRPGVAEHERKTVALLAKRLDVPFFHGEANIPAVVAKHGGNAEERARTIRYQWLSSTASAHGYAVIATGHNQDDHIETMLLQLLRGSANLLGIRKRYRKLVRPMLGISAAELRAYLTELGEFWITDKTNFDTTYNRVWLRYDIMPQLEARYTNARSALARFAHTQTEQQEALQALALQVFPKLPWRVAALQQVPKTLVNTALAEHLKAANLPVSQDILADAYQAIMQRTTWQRDLSSGVSLVVQYGQITLLTESTPASKLPAPWRPLQAGDKMRRGSGTKLVHEVLIDEKIPAHERANLYVQETGGYVTEIAGLFRVNSDGHVEWTERHRKFMSVALAEALRAANAGEVPVGAVVVSSSGEILGTGRNRRENGSPLAHAEIEAITRAAEATGDWRLAGATLYVTLEPCPMCAGAILQTHMNHVVFGADNYRDGALGTVTNLFGANWKRSVAVTGGIFADKSAKLLRMAFEEARVR